MNRRAEQLNVIIQQTLARAERELSPDDYRELLEECDGAIEQRIAGLMAVEGE